MKLFKSGTGTAGVATAMLFLGCGAALAATSYMAFLSMAESTNNPSAKNPYSTAQGLYQMSNPALQAVGYQDKFGNWTGKDGVNSQADYFANTQAQTNSAVQYAQQNWKSQVNYGNDKLVGQTVNGIQVNQAVLIDCSHYLGASGCNDWLKDGRFSAAALKANPNIQTTFGNRMAKASQTDASDITNGQNTVVNNSVMNNGSTAGGNGVPSIYCNPEIATMMQQNGMQAVQQWTMLAGAPGTGYTTMGGGSVLQAAGLAGGGQNGALANMLGVNDSDYYMVSCIDRLMNSGLNIFGSFTLSDILAKLQQAACQAIYGLFSQITQPLDQSLGKYSGLGIPGIPGFMPGIGLGSIGGGLNTSITPGNPNGNGPTVNFGGNGGSAGSFSGSTSMVNGDTSWYPSQSSQQSYSGSSYGPLMGGSGYSSPSGGNSSFLPR